VDVFEKVLIFENSLPYHIAMEQAAVSHFLWLVACNNKPELH